MRLTKLRLLGFKSFVEATDFLIEPGLTGVVGPNGCGKSNLVEALRWVMGESSHKSLRAAEMDDVIFAGSGGRPSRNSAEVVLTVDNRDRTAPSAFNDAETLEISRRIERDQGSNYRINGREVRARDVQLIFADASTGARSPSLVRQGQIAELIAAKPQARRRILEEAAGIAGLHTRRHEAELRLKAAEQNLDRLEDVLGQIGTQVEGLKRQSRQAIRYRALSGQIRRAEALLHHIAFEEAGRQVIEAEGKLDADVRMVAERTRAQAEAARLAAVASHEMTPLRDAEAAAAAVLQRLTLARETLDLEERRAAERVAELGRRIAQATGDVERESAMIADAADVLARLAAEAASLDGEATSAAEGRAAVEHRIEAAEAALARSEGELAGVQAGLAQAEAGRTGADRALREATGRVERFERELAEVVREQAAVEARAEDAGTIDAARRALADAREAGRRAEALCVAADGRSAAARQAEEASRGPLADADRKAARLETEVRTLAKLLLAPGRAGHAPVADAVRVTKGYETSLGAALGDDLDAGTEPGAPVRWAGSSPTADDPALPGGVASLSSVVEAPAVLHRRLAQIGMVPRAEGAALMARLRPGQSLVSREGDLWRWDGFTSSANAPTPAARRLAERNRLAELEAETIAARAAVGPLQAVADAARVALAEAIGEESAAREAWRQASRIAERKAEALSVAERGHADIASRSSALAEARSRLTASRDEAIVLRREAETGLAALPELAGLSGRFETCRLDVASRRAAAAEARAAGQAMLREAELRTRRLGAIAAELGSWRARRDAGSVQVEALRARLADLEAERAGLGEVPTAFAAERRAILSAMADAEAARRAAADRLAEAQTRLAAADRDGREAFGALGLAREERARSEERLDGLRTRRAQLARDMEEALSVPPSGALRLAGLGPGDRLPDRAALDQDLDQARRERDRLGAVNLRAEDELDEVQAQLDGLVRERDDLVEAIKRLRQAIAGLNREGRERLLAAFDIVNVHFQRLFSTLFGGGTAELLLTESDDPLEAGLDILARPPGKKPQTLSLLSGGEQALTAMALIFAVFLTNPAPICVLDEVDAPLDDANVERFCNLLDEMTRLTRTRFVTITHNPITMARMDRLFGVTMAERGVSQLVSVDLVGAERIREAV